MAYVAMNSASFLSKSVEFFLNGVCRHERVARIAQVHQEFLNGVCRHEHRTQMVQHTPQFLNGVCRHELCA